IIEVEALDSVYNETLNNIGNVYNRLGIYDSAFLYYRKALSNAHKFKMLGKEAYILSDIGRLYYDIHKYDSASYYLKMGNKIAQNYKLFSVLSNNYLSFAEIEEVRGNTKNALYYYKQYTTIKDSLFNSSKYASINELEFTYNMSKVDKKIQELNIEQEIQERTILMQRRLQLLTSLAVLALTSFLVMMYRKNKNLNQAYNKLVVKNVEIVNVEKKMQLMQEEYKYKLNQKDLLINQMGEKQLDISETRKEGDKDKAVKYKDIVIGNDSQKELLSDIFEIMNDKSIYCDPEFSVLKLAERVNSNSSYVSYIINNTVGKNFRSFINDYRIKEACCILAESKVQKYSIESIATMVGFKSKSAFNTTFKEVTGVTPSFYIKSIQKDRQG
ncbi:MAG: AraC family transcriptional regulator, partial [Bacteroidales bacterium]